MTTTTTPRVGALAGSDGKIGILLAAMLVAGNMMGSGVYLLPTVLAGVGGISLLGWGAAVTGALLLAAMFAGFADYDLFGAGQQGLMGRISESVGRFWAFQAASLYSISCWVGNVAIALGVTGSAAQFVPALAHGGASLGFTLACILVMTLVNIYGSPLVSRLQTATLLIGLAPIAVIGVAGWFVFRPTLFASQWNVNHLPVAKALGATVLPIFWAFLGLESAAMCCVRLRDPEKNLAPATVLGVGLAGVIYAVSCVVLLGILPAKAIAGSTHPFADGALAIFGVGIGTVVAVCAMVRASGALAGWILVSAETAQSAAASGLIPTFLARPGDKATPRTLVLVGVVTVGITLMSVAPALAEQFTLLIDVSVILTLVMYIISAVALWRLTAGERRRGRKFYLRGTAVLASLFCGVVIAFSGLQMQGVTVAAMVLAALGYAITPRPAAV